MTHEYIIEDNSKKTIKLILLALYLLISLMNAVFMVTMIFVRNWFNLIYVAVIWIILLLFRIPTTYLTRKLIYKFSKDEVTILVEYPMSSGKSYKFKYDDIEFIENDNVEKKDKLVRLSSKSCTFKHYMIKYQNEKYIIALDEYGYCMINRSTNDIL